MCPGACGEQQRLGCKGRDWLPPRPDVAEYRQGFALLSGWGGRWTWTVSGEAYSA